MKKEQIKYNIRIIKLINGDDIVCNLPTTQLTSKTPLITIEKPLQIKYVSKFTATGLKDYIALIKWLGYTHDTLVNIPKDKIMAITSATEQMTKSYFEIIVNYDKLDTSPEKKQIDIPKEQMSKDDNDDFNELWDDFRDEEDTIH
jgi:hypothetical protein